MTALGAGTSRARRGTPLVKEFPVYASAVIYKGGGVMVNSSGYAIPAADTASCRFVGIAQENATGTASSGAVKIKVEYGCEFLFAASSVTQAHLQTGPNMYVVDDNTVDETSTNSVEVGVMTEFVSTTSCWVLVTGAGAFPTVGVTATTGEINKLASVTGGTAAASKAVVLGASKEIATITSATITTLTSTTGNITTVNATNVDAGASGTAGSVDVFPATGSKGKLAITCTDQTGDTTVGLVAGAMAAARTITIPDPGAAANVLMTTGTATATDATTAEITRACDTSARLVAAGATLSVTEALHDGKIICLDTLGGSVCTLPNATGSGDVFRFLISVVNTSANHIIKVARAADTMVGQVYVLDMDSDAVIAYAASGTDDTLTLPGTTAGGAIGDWFDFVDVVANKWAVRGFTICVAGQNKADVFSATVN